ncbi:MAG: Lrp/AsnC family transcriptional regulator [Deltaproteobacteria bacterium]|nr:Lrp/AsnC family transcriptional regulator [Deltaproteobacteria bacterium]
MELDRLDREILNRIQGDFPVSTDPYGDIGRPLGLSGAEALACVRSLVERGVVRKVGPFFDAKRMGYRSTLCAVNVDPGKIGEIAAVINAFPEVTHNYLREGSPNLWFTVIAPTDGAIGEIISDISERASIGPIRNLPARKMFKVKVDLKVEEKGG